MNVTFLTTNYPVPNSPTYGGGFFRALAEALFCQGIRVRVVAPVPVARRKSKGVPLKYDWNGVIVERPRILSPPRIGKWFNLPAQYARCVLETPKPDILHAHFASPPGIASTIVKQQWNVANMLTLHGSDVNVFPKTGGHQLAQFISAMNGHNVVTAVSTSLATTAEAMSCVMPVVQPLGINPCFFQPQQPKNEARHILGLPRHAFIVLFVGNITKDKGVLDLATAVSGTDVNVVLCGEGSLRRSLATIPSFLFAGAHPPETIAQYMAASDVLVLPSHHEGLGLVIAEAGACRLPVIGSRVGGIPELLDCNRGILVSPKRPDLLRDAILKVRFGEGSATDAVDNLESFVRSHYSADTCAKQFIHLYEATIKGNTA